MHFSAKLCTKVCNFGQNAIFLPKCQFSAKMPFLPKMPAIRLKSEGKSDLPRTISSFQTGLYGQNKARIWQFVNQITHFKRKSSTSIKSLIDKHGKKLTDATDIANSLNNHFGSIGKIMAKEFDNMDSTRLKDPLSYVSKEVQNSIFLTLPTAQEISKKKTFLS